jgi:hypothetical protein
VMVLVGVQWVEAERGWVESVLYCGLVMSILYTGDTRGQVEDRDVEWRKGSTLGSTATSAKQSTENQPRLTVPLGRGILHPVALMTRWTPHGQCTCRSATADCGPSRRNGSRM